LDICVLSAEEAARFENYGIWPTCKAHRHMKRSKALAAIHADTHRFVGGPNTKVLTPVSMVAELNHTFEGEVVCDICGKQRESPIHRVRGWRPQQAHNLNGSPVMGFKIWGLAAIR
jgi:hypothetical protein